MTTDLKIVLFRWNAETYGANMHFSQPDSDADIHPFPGNAKVRFDMQTLLAHQLDSKSYGQLLSEILFGDPKMRSAFDQARKIAQVAEIPLRVRLFIEASAWELNALRWETLRYPDDDAPLITGERIIFSRYFASRDSRPVRLLQQWKLWEKFADRWANMRKLRHYIISVDFGDKRKSIGKKSPGLCQKPGQSGRAVSVNG